MKQDIANFFDEFRGDSRAEVKVRARERLAVEVTETILIELERAGISKTDLARALSKSKGFVSQVLSGRRNMTLGTLSDIAFEIDLVPRIYFTPRSAQLPPFVQDTVAGSAEPVSSTRTSSASLPMVAHGS